MISQTPQCSYPLEHCQFQKWWVSSQRFKWGKSKLAFGKREDLPSVRRWSLSKVLLNPLYSRTSLERIRLYQCRLELAIITLLLTFHEANMYKTFHRLMASHGHNRQVTLNLIFYSRQTDDDSRKSVFSKYLLKQCPVFIV